MNTKSKFKIVIPIIILAVVVSGLAMPSSVNAGVLHEAGKGIFSVLGEIIRTCLMKLLTTAVSLFEGALGIGFDSKTTEVVKTGWTACRDFANMLFILIMVIIAFGTILRIEQYGVKKLLPKIIGIALLINFSFVLCSVIVDFSNITANFFIKDIKGKIGSQGGEKGMITAVFADAFNITGTAITITDCDNIYKGLISNCKSDADCVENANGILKKCRKDQGIEVKVEDEAFLDIFFGIVLGSIVMIMAIFALSAGALMILFRIIAIWFLITIVPLAFICYALPGLQENWKKWWTKFLHWCIFAPAYTFFIWIAIQIATTQANKKIGMIASQYAITGNYKVTANAFQSNPGGELISFFIIIGFLVGSIVVAQALGIHGANAVMKIATDTKKGVAGWMGRQAMRPTKGLGRLAGAGALTAGGALFGGKLGRRMRARATEMRMRPEKDPRNVAYERLISTMSDGDVMKESMVKGITPGQKIRKLIATRNAARRGLLRDATTNEAGEAMKTFKGFNDFEAYQKLKETRLDAIENNTERDNTTQKVVQEGNINKIPAIALKDERVVAALGRFASAVQIESLRNASPQHATNLKTSLDTLTTVGNAILSGMSALDQEKIHHSYASQTGDIDRMSSAQLVNWAKKSGADGIKRISSASSSANLEILANNMPTNQLANIVEKMQDNVAAKNMVRYLSTATSPIAAANKFAVNNNPYLKTLI
ncbi:hypothetical protein KKF60_03265 [Patescibacteria group bacterium]|nr:hypothetical protein [Patescibacteria group bacterium]MBU4458887.1 hypothetical protein [Patescibacteria group bacterium]MCG2696169.1 hypothetical protein [Candidatus Portnoybacteria bacterium]